MSLYGALFTGVTGLNAQGEKLAVISDNISNTNTYGYKRAETNFRTLVVNSSTAGAYSPGGVLTNTRYHMDQQGIISATESGTDIAVSGDGFFTVNANSDGSGEPLYTRVGSFRQDADGNFVNANGFYLRAWRLDEEGRLPGETGNVTNTVSNTNLESLSTVNVESVSGVAEATTQITVAANLDAEEEIFPGESVTVNMDSNSTNNYQITSTDIIVPDETNATNPSFGLATTNNIARGDAFTVLTGNGLEYDYFYGGFTIGRDVDVTGAANMGDGATDLSSTAFTTGDTFAVTTAGVVTVTVAGGHGLALGSDSVRIENFVFSGASNGLAVTDLNTTHVVNVGATNTFTFTLTNTPTAVVTSTVTAAMTTAFTTRLFTGNILDANSSADVLIDPSTLNNYTTNARSFTIATPTGGTSTFTYQSSSPDASAGQFNSLNNLATAISLQPNLTARVVDGRLVVGALDATESVTFANVDATGGGTATTQGIDWVTELDLTNVAASTRRFSTMDGLANLINDDDGVTASITDPSSESTMDIRVDDPEDTIQLTDFTGTFQNLGLGNMTITSTAALATVTLAIPAHGLPVGANIALQNVLPDGNFGGFTTGDLTGTFQIAAVTTNSITLSIVGAGFPVLAAATNADDTAAAQYAQANNGSLLAEFGLTDEEGALLVPSLMGGVYTPGDTGALGPKYDSSGIVGENIASGDLTPQFSHNVRIYDSLGAGHDITFAYIKTDTNTWAVEIYGNSDEVSTLLPDGQIAVGEIVFNGDGSLRSVSSSLTGNVTVGWQNGAATSTLALDLGTAGSPFGTVGAAAIGDVDGLRQFADNPSSVIFVDQDGSPVGDLVSVIIDEEGFVTATYSNGENEQLYKIPLADFSNPNGLRPISGTVFAETTDSGEVLLRQVGDNGVGVIVPGSLENSNVDLSNELTDMIVAQRTYQANTRVLSTADELLEQLNQL